MFNVTDKVNIDGSDIIGVVTAILIRQCLGGISPLSLYKQYEVQWFSSGVLHTGWFEEWRLDKV